MGGVIHMKEKMIVFVKKETVLVVAAILAVMSAFFVHPDQAYIDYIDFRVLGILLSLMIIMAGVQNNGIFDGIGRRRKIRRSWHLFLFFCVSFQAWSLPMMLRF